VLCVRAVTPIPREPLPLNVFGRTRADTVAVPHEVEPACALALAPLLACE
jgi:hypothetical protein